MTQSRQPIAEASSRGLSTDPIVRIAALAALVLLALYLLPVVDAETLAFIDEFVAIPVLLGTILVGTLVPTPRAGAERWFWTIVSTAFGSWIAVEMTLIFLAVLYPPSNPSVRIDVAHCLYYACMALAIEIRPHLRSDPQRRSVGRALSAAGAMVFLVGMLAYFAIVPASLDTESYADYVPSYLLYIGLDLYLALRFFALFRDADSGRWRAVYGLLCATELLGAGSDCLELLNVHGVVTILRASAWSLLWYPSYFAAILAVRVRLLPDPPPAPARERERVAARGGPSLVYYLVALPAIHLLVHLLDLIGEASQVAHEALLLALLAAIGTLTVAQQVVQRLQRRRLEADLDETRTELQRSRRMEAVGRLAGAVAHDFNNLLTAIRGSSDLLRFETEGRPQAEALCNTIDRAADHAGALTQQLLAFGRRQSLQPAAIDLNGVVADDRELLATVCGRGVALHVAARATNPWILFDPAQIHGVLVNLTANARDAMPDGGSLTIQTRDAPGDGKGGQVVLEVTDTGHGIDPEDLDRIFEPFFTTKPRGRGTGLGLATVYGLVEQSGGRIEVESRPGVGTTFRIYLKRTDAPAARPEPPPAAPGPAAGQTVLVVDDDRDVRELVSRFLAAEGYRVLTADGGRAALEVAGSENGPIDLLLTDVVMPVMSGPALATRVAAERPDTRILFMSGHTGGEELTAGGPLLRKPFGREAAVAAVRAALGSAAADARPAAEMARQG